MLQRRIMQALLGYLSAAVVVFSAIMLIPSFGSDAGGSWTTRLRDAVAEVPALWLSLLPTAFMLTVLMAVSRIGLRGELRVWRASGASVWPFARATALVGLLVSALLVGPLWPLARGPAENGPGAASSPALYRDASGGMWALPLGSDLSHGAKIDLFSVAENQTGTRSIVVSGTLESRTSGGGLQLGTLTHWSQDLAPDLMTLTPIAGEVAQPPQTRARQVSKRASFPVLVAALGLLILPLALSMDGQRWTILKIAGGCLLALNALFIVLLSNALAEAGFWNPLLFYPLRAALIAALALLLLVFVEERMA